MPEEKNDVTTDRISMLKKAGVPWPVIVLFMFASLPGATNWLFDDRGTQAQVQAQEAENKADVAYEVLAAEIKEIKGENRQLAQRVQNQYGVIMILLQKGVGIEGASEVDIVNEIVNTPVERTSRPVSRRRPSSGSGRGAEPETAPMAELVPPEVLEDVAEQNEMPPQEQRKALPKNLDALMK